MTTEGSVANAGQHQALNGDYPSTGYDKGHLAPVFHRNTQTCVDATFTLTNAAPQASRFNRVTWRTAEGRVSRHLTNNCLNNGFRAYIVTGVVPGNTIPPLKGRVNVPARFWSAYCCVDNNNVPQDSGAYHGVNDNNTRAVTTTTVANLNNILRFRVFGNFC